MVEYEHKQPGSRFILGAMAVISLIVLGAFVWTICRAPQNDTADAINFYIFFGVMISTVIILFGGVLMMSSLTVKVEDGLLKAIFGLSIVRKTIKLDQVKSAEPVKNSFGHGWGIHYFRGCWVYNVAGWEAVEITLESGKKVRIGTDEPEKLCQPINEAIAKSN